MILDKRVSFKSDSLWAEAGLYILGLHLLGAFNSPVDTYTQMCFSALHVLYGVCL